MGRRTVTTGAMQLMSDCPTIANHDCLNVRPANGGNRRSTKEANGTSFISVHCFQLIYAFADQSMTEDVEDKIEQYDTQDEEEDEIAQFEECSKTICAGAQDSAETTWAPVAYVEVMNDFRRDRRQAISAVETNDASDNLGEPKFDAYSLPIDAFASDSVV